MNIIKAEDIEIKIKDKKVENYILVALNTEKNESTSVFEGNLSITDTLNMLDAMDTLKNKIIESLSNQVLKKSKEDDDNCDCLACQLRRKLTKIMNDNPGVKITKDILEKVLSELDKREKEEVKK